MPDPSISTCAALIARLERQRTWSQETFGPRQTAKGICNHVRKELGEIEADPTDPTEWMDIVCLAFDGAMRFAAAPADVVAAWIAKLDHNETREWPDWRTQDPDGAIEHVRAESNPSPDIAISEVRERLAKAEPFVDGNPGGCAVTIRENDLRALLADHAGLVAEVERLKHCATELFQQRLDERTRAEAAESALSASKAREEALVEGLRPFAELCEAIGAPDELPNDVVFPVLDMEAIDIGDIRLGDLRRARAIIAKRGEG